MSYEQSTKASTSVSYRVAVYDLTVSFQKVRSLHDRFPIYYLKATLWLLFEYQAR